VERAVIRELTPLEEIEQRVQARAKETVLDMTALDARQRLRALIDDEVAQWSDDFRRGRRDFDLADPLAVADRADRNLAGYGPLEPLLDDDDVWEVMINSPTSIFVKRHSGTSGYYDEVFHDDDQLREIDL
jgi:pilus assembly protein CpaF